MSTSAQCRICHKRIGLNADNRIKVHQNKYRKTVCEGAYKPPIQGSVVTEQPTDYVPVRERVPCHGDSEGLVCMLVIGAFSFGLCWMGFLRWSVL